MKPHQHQHQHQHQQYAQQEQNPTLIEPDHYENCTNKSPSQQESAFPCASFIQSAVDSFDAAMAKGRMVARHVIAQETSRVKKHLLDEQQDHSDSSKRRRLSPSSLPQNNKMGMLYLQEARSQRMVQLLSQLDYLHDQLANELMACADDADLREDAAAQEEEEEAYDDNDTLGNMSE
eukprot:CAMPEP_0198141962 /NCGR_PEP_ID=MMETSP1443-20131203/4874_1 /TAXON_ID=186043 /ORGANISM="Entomoneis sp., Strain CCMP2396" /LENGTH=176 /DNA_ID=CAMNT_0043804865 /DNA_START=54 /DNA_END=584 /DNA_ORIENTATION=+